MPRAQPTEAPSPEPAKAAPVEAEVEPQVTPDVEPQVAADVDEEPDPARGVTSAPVDPAPGETKQDQHADGESVDDEPGSAAADATDGADVKEPEAPPLPSLVDILRLRLQEKEDQLHSYIAAYKQAKEEMAKVQDRLKRDRIKEVARAKMDAARDLLDVLDNLDRTVEGAPKEGPAAALADGVRMVREQFEAVLQGFGVERMRALGGTFDPKLHEAVGMIPAPPDKADQEILFVQRAGYLFDGALLRAAQVIIAAES
jgi:molecular chaperone GrpE